VPQVAQPDYPLDRITYGRRMANGDDALVTSQLRYYDAGADEYRRKIGDIAARKLFLDRLDAFAPGGDVLELACGTGQWTVELLGHATSVTAVDGSLRMLEHTAEQTDGRAHLVHADLFSWHPERRYDVVFFGFWLSHVPEDRFDDFWSMVESALRPGGRVLFFDDADRPEEEQVEGPSSATVERRLEDGSRHRIVKVPWEPPALSARLASLGWVVSVETVDGPFYAGAGGRAHDSAAR
jgi:SAM-dependent methyltransferase